MKINENCVKSYAELHFNRFSTSKNKQIATSGVPIDFRLSHNNQQQPKVNLPTR